MVKKPLKNYCVVVGARPNFMKAAPIFINAKHYPGLKFTLVNTGQHFDVNMSKIFFDQLKLPKPRVQLNNIETEYYTERIGKMLNGLKLAFSKLKFDGVIVFGDVHSTLVGAIAAAWNNLKVIHVEAGLRSYDRRMPEEINRVIVDHLSDLLFTTEPSANENLIRESIKPSRIKYVGNIMIEALEIFQKDISASGILEKMNLKPRTYIVATVHRQENVDNRFLVEKISSALQKVNCTIPIILPLHPGTQKAIKTLGLSRLLRGLRVVKPLGYFDFIRLISQSRGVITDSGGIQDETSHLGIPCCTLRDNTEKPITVELGSNKLFSPNAADTDAMLEHIMNGKFQSGRIPLWDNGVSKRILDVLDN